LALGPLVDDAISKANYALAAQLEHLRAIINEALYNLDQIANQRIAQIDDAAKNRIAQLQTVANQQMGMLNDIVSGRITQIDSATEARIKQLGDTAGALVESLPIPVAAMIDVPPTGFSVVKEIGDYTSIFITGAGLFKQSEKPTAYILKDGEKEARISHAGTEITVKTASMGLIELSIPNSLFPASSSPADYVLKLHLRKGPAFIPTHEDPSFPILMCTTLPQLKATVIQSASGQYYEKRRVPYESPRGGVPDGVYIDDNGSNNSTDVCADSFGGWEVDPEEADNGLEISGEIKSHADGSNVYKDQPRPGCYHLYAGKDSSGGGFAFVRGVFVHQRHLADTNKCADVPPYLADLRYGISNKIATDLSVAIGPCAKAPSRTPIIKTNVAVRAAEGDLSDNGNIVPKGGGINLVGNLARASEDEFGLVQIDLNSECSKRVKDYKKPH